MPWNSQSDRTTNTEVKRGLISFNEGKKKHTKSVCACMCVFVFAVNLIVMATWRFYCRVFASRAHSTEALYFFFAAS